MSEGCFPGSTAGVVCVRGGVGCPVDHPTPGSEHAALDRERLGMLLATSVRYALGRRSHLVEAVIAAVGEHFADVPFRWRETIVRDLRAELRAPDRHHDDEAWAALLAWTERHTPVGPDWTDPLAAG